MKRVFVDANIVIDLRESWDRYCLGIAQIPVPTTIATQVRISEGKEVDTS
jgi:hypothetical protein